MIEYTISKHCLEQINLRSITEDEISRIIKNPDSIIKQDEEITVYQALTNDKMFLIRIFVNILKHPNLVVTAYKTSKIDKYYENKI